MTTFHNFFWRNPPMSDWPQMWFSVSKHLFSGLKWKRHSEASHARGWVSLPPFRAFTQQSTCQHLWISTLGVNHFISHASQRGQKIRFDLIFTPDSKSGFINFQNFQIAANWSKWYSKSWHQCLIRQTCPGLVTNQSTVLKFDYLTKSTLYSQTVIRRD